MVLSFMTFNVCCRNGTVRVRLVEMWPDILYMLFKRVITFFLGQVFFLIPWTNWNRLSFLTMDWKARKTSAFFIFWHLELGDWKGGGAP